MNKYDLIIIGGGPGGYSAAEKAALAGLKVALFEGNKLGGICLNEGCIPTKSFLYSAKIYENAFKGKPYGIEAQDLTINHEAILKRKSKVVKKLVAGVKVKLASADVDVINEFAEIKGKIGGKDATDNEYAIEAGGIAYTANNLLIATGADSIVPEIPGAMEGMKEGYALTSHEILDMKEIPDKLTIVGGGIVGLEMANYFAIAGSEVTVTVRNRIVSAFDHDISDILLGNLQKKGIIFKMGFRVTEIGNSYAVAKSDDAEEKIVFDKLLFSMGRKPNLEGYGLETLDIATEKDAIVVDSNMKTNAAGVYAIGDVIGKSMLAHTAVREGEVAVNSILGINDEMSYKAIPSVIYTSPEVAVVGETALTAEKKGIETETLELPMTYSGRYVAETERGDGICKLIKDAKTNKLIGAHIIGNYASEIITIATLMIESERTVEDFEKVVFPHPTVCEIYKEILL